MIAQSHTDKLDLTSIKEEVMEVWEQHSEETTKYLDEHGRITEKGEEVLASVTLMLDQLGFSSISEYVRSKKEPGIHLGYALISKTRTKYFFGNMEFYIDRDPETSTATLWVRPGYTASSLRFCRELLEELERASKKE